MRPAVTRCGDPLAAGETKPCVTIEREAEVKSALLDYAALDTTHKAVALAQLASASVVARS